ncbi:MAG TPA: hypothetical protein DCW59_01190, partial [Alteromonas sp.]|nr:hypothetical protein [Alteromonas sp.]
RFSLANGLSAPATGNQTGPMSFAKLTLLSRKCHGPAVPPDCWLTLLKLYLAKAKAVYEFNRKQKLT